MRKYRSAALAALLAASVGASTVRADDAITDAPAIIETVNGVARVLLKCASDQMPVMTEGPTVEIDAGKMTRYDHGISKCADITETVRHVDAGGSGTARFADGRTLGVINCPKGTVPFVLELTKAPKVTWTRDPKQPLPPYSAYGPVTVRCVEETLMSPRG